MLRAYFAGLSEFIIIIAEFRRLERNIVIARGEMLHGRGLRGKINLCGTQLYTCWTTICAHLRFDFFYCVRSLCLGVVHVHCFAWII